MSKESIESLLRANQQWVEEELIKDPNFFKELAKGQTPQFLWIGCSDSRVPADRITGTKPGEIFVHRNIANLVLHTDLNMLSVLEYAVAYLKVKHIIVCGHYGCGGVRAAISRNNYELLNKWLRNIKDIYVKNEALLHAIPDSVDRENALVELSIKQQIENLMKTSVVQKAWHLGEDLTLHGMVYDLTNGRLQQLIQYDRNSPLPEIYRFYFDED
ncbi:MAG: carbonic anhydrase [Bacteroidetes bacterium]|nr:carbonic anhydrase [Bacteroidota bacterium]MDA0943054.1 carbonic anhydrase [Bacteroidota bacterium]MDA1112429.1 carbonic anhydrase [Bacteroidota bacterium]